MTQLLSSGFTDTFRAKYPDAGGLLLVELPLSRPGEERRVADRLLHRLRPPDAPGAGGRHPQRDLRQ